MTFSRTECPVAASDTAGSSFDYIYEREQVDSVLRQLLPDELRDPEVTALGCNGFLLRVDLYRLKSRAASYLARSSPAGSDQLLLDVGCGLGGLGRWLASELGTRLMGVDISRLAIENASRTMAPLPLAKHTRFEVGDFTSIALSDDSGAVAISLDALYLAEDPQKALGEVYRVLGPRGGLVFTVYTSHRPYPGATGLLVDWCPLLKEAGFLIDHFSDVSPEWRRVMRVKHALRWQQQDWLRDQLGLRAEPELSVSAGMLGFHGKPSFLDQVHRFEISARKHA